MDGWEDAWKEECCWRKNAKKNEWEERIAKEIDE